MKFQKGDIVRFNTGSVDWEVQSVVYHRYYILKSPMSGRRKKAFEHEVKPWTPGA